MEHVVAPGVEGATPGVGGYTRWAPEVGEPVEVATRFTGSWSRGFAVADVEIDGLEHHGYRLRRLSDGALLPVAFAVHELRADRRGVAAPSSGAA